MGAICAVKKAAFDGVDCVGGDDTATGTVRSSPKRLARTRSRVWMNLKKCMQILQTNPVDFRSCFA